MAQATITRIGDRLDAINASIAGLNNKRRLPQNVVNSALLPMIFPSWAQARHTVPGAGARQYSGARSWELVLVLGDWEMGLPSESVLVRAETFTQAVLDCYITRPRLELAGEPLDGVESASLQTDTGPVPMAEYPVLACVRFPLLIVTHSVFEYNTE